MDHVNNQDIERNLQDREQTRKALTQKLETLETRMRDNIEKVKQSVRNSTDLKYQVGKRPWVMFGLSIVLGSVAGRILMGNRRSATVRSRPPVEDNIRKGSDSIWTSIGKLATNMNLDQYSQALERAQGRLYGRSGVDCYRSDTSTGVSDFDAIR